MKTFLLTSLFIGSLTESLAFFARARPDENVRIAAVGVLLEEDNWLKHELGMTGMEPKLPASAS